jgi:low affinity Fe/Cu permease
VPRGRDLPTEQRFAVKHSPSSDSTPIEALRHMRPKEIYKGNELFRRIASKTAHAVGHPLTFAAAIGIVILWAASGKLFGFSDTWQLVINTGTTIVTFLMVFLIQNTQNRDSHAIHLKLDELIRANRHARNRLMAVEELPENELDALQKEFEAKACERVEAHRRTRHSNDSISSRRGSDDAE